MKNRQVKPNRREQYAQFREAELMVSDVAQYLSGLASLNDHYKAGNPCLSEGLRIVARVLQPYSSLPILELTEVMKGNSPSLEAHPLTRAPVKPVFPPDLDAKLETIGLDEIDEILLRDGCTKRQIVELGLRRFGISRSRLEHLNKRDAQDTVLAALEHEKSLDVIAREANKSGKSRTS